MPDRRNESSVASTLREWAKKIEPPRFDRIVIHDLRPFHSIPRRDHAPSIGGGHLPDALMGFPVFTDEKVEVGVIELRLGDEVVERVHLSELRA